VTFYDAYEYSCRTSQFVKSKAKDLSGSKPFVCSSQLTIYIVITYNRLVILLAKRMLSNYYYSYIPALILL
jgi:hypothetical protein